MDCLEKAAELVNNILLFNLGIKFLPPGVINVFDVKITLGFAAYKLQKSVYKLKFRSFREECKTIDAST